LTYALLPPSFHVFGASGSKSRRALSKKRLR
jgi:hypothetical protein